jgi:dTDP-4-dehydrorhamnose reductase
VDGFGVADADIGDRRAWGPRLAAFQPDLVLHLAAMTAVDRCEEAVDEAFRVNAEGSRLVAAEAEAAGAAVIGLSTDYVFDGTAGTPYAEDAEPRPLNVYGRSKLAGEEAMRGAATAWAVVRSAWLFGSGGPNFVDTILGLLDTRETVSVVADQTGSPTHAGDLADALTALCPLRPRGVYHLANTGSASWFELARKAVALAGLDPDRVRPATTGEVARPAPRPRFSVLETGRAEREHGIRLRTWGAALADYVKARAGAAGGEAV